MNAPNRSSGVGAAEALARRLDRPMGILGMVFLFVVLGQLLVTEPLWSRLLTVTGWAFWAVFVAEFLLRAYIAGFQLAFWKRNWWQVLFLLVPFLRFFRAFQALRLVRLTRIGGVLSAGVRGTRSAGRLLTNRIGWLAAATLIVVLASSQLLYATGAQPHYGEALYEASLATVTGGGITTRDLFSRILQVVLAIYSVAVFATLAGSVGAYFLRGSPGPASGMSPSTEPHENAPTRRPGESCPPAGSGPNPKDAS